MLAFACAVGGALAGASCPPGAMAARMKVAEPVAAATTSSGDEQWLSPNLIRLPDGMRKDIDDFTLDALSRARDVVRVVLRCRLTSSSDHLVVFFFFF